MLKLSAKCSISAFNAQGLRGIIVVVQIRTVKIYVSVQEKKKKGWNSQNNLIWVSPPLNVNVFFLGFF